jgi:predicted RNA methylase
MSQLAIDICGPERDTSTLSQWHTGAELARNLVLWSRLCIARGGYSMPRSVVEPSAGGGMILRAICEQYSRADICAVEIDPEWSRVCDLELNKHRRLMREIGREPFLVSICNDWLETERRTFGLAVMNPPYEGGQDREHLRVALDRCDHVVALVRLNMLAGKNAWLELRGYERLNRIAIMAGRPKFNGTEGGAKSDFCALYFARDESDEPRVEWWPL